MAEALKTSNPAPTPHVNTIDPNAPAGSPTSLGAESVRDGRPSSDDSVVEAMDEESPAVPSTTGNPGV